jgi:CHAT domain-containing protein
MFKRLLPVLLLFPVISHSQPQVRKALWDHIKQVDSRRDQTPAEKLRALYLLLREANGEGAVRDSVYARLLHKIGAYEYNLNKNHKEAIRLTIEAADINSTNQPGGSKGQASIDYFNLGVFYDDISLFGRSLPAYDLADYYARISGDPYDVILDSKINRAVIFFRMGDYQKAVEECELGIDSSLLQKDTLHYITFLCHRATSLFFIDRISAALADLQVAIRLAQPRHADLDMASALKMKGYIDARQRNFPAADSSFQRCIDTRMKTGDAGMVAGDLNDWSNFLMDSLSAYARASAGYLRGLKYANQVHDTVRMARIALNLGQCYFKWHQDQKAKDYCLQSMKYLKLGIPGDFVHNPSADALLSIGNRELLQHMFNNKTELSLALYKKEGKQEWLDACLRTAMLNDSLITLIRHEQTGEHSKLHWRELTHDFFSNALEAAFLANKPDLVFYFMEKSRSVLLMDRINELGANAVLPHRESLVLDSFRISLVGWQHILNSLPDTSFEYRKARLGLLTTKQDMEKHIRSLETSYPVYYRYKIDDKVPSLPDLQHWLGNTGQRFMDYWIEDTFALAICVTPSKIDVRKIQIPEGGLNRLLNQLTRSCSDANELNQNYRGYTHISNQIYKLLFEPFHLTPGRVVICQDNPFVPFEALYDDSHSTHFLLESYSFSYVYSATNLLNQSNQGNPEGNFLGVAPINFKYSGLAPLQSSGQALMNCSAYFALAKTITEKEATHDLFMSELPKYKVVTVLTHAYADSSDNEPVLYLSDSVIRLSELEWNSKPATCLVILSACLSNRGKSYAGEGVYSLARGFSSAGIPAVAATLWEADEEAIYHVSEKFNEYISAGMNKDEALQKAKLYYIGQKKRRNSLPFYWANMVLIGNADPVIAMKRTVHPGEIIAFAVIVLLVLWLGFRYRYRKTRKLL